MITFEPSANVEALNCEALSFWKWDISVAWKSLGLSSSLVEICTSLGWVNLVLLPLRVNVYESNLTIDFENMLSMTGFYRRWYLSTFYSSLADRTNQDTVNFNLPSLAMIVAWSIWDTKSLPKVCLSTKSAWLTVYLWSLKKFFVLWFVRTYLDPLI